MPIHIKQYERRVDLAGVPGARQNLRDTRGEALADVGQGLVRATAGVSSLVQKVEEEQDKAAIDEAYTKLVETRRSLLDDPEHGLVTRRGKNAGTDSPGFIDNWKVEYDKTLAELTETQRLKFADIARHQDDSFRTSVSHHVEREGDGLRKQNFEAALTAAADDAASSAARGEHHKVQDAVMNGRGSIEAHAAIEGWDKDFTETQLKAFETRAHLGVLEHMIGQGDADGAAEYLATARSTGGLDGAMIVNSKIEKIIAAGQLDTSAEKLASEAWDSATRNEKGEVVAKEGDPARAMAYLREKGIKNQKLLDESIQRVQQRGSMETAARRQADAPLIGEFEMEILESSSGRFRRGNPKFERLSKQGQADVLRMEEARRRTLKTASNEDRREQRQIDERALWDFRARQLYGEPGEDQSSVPIDAVYPGASKEYRDRMRELQNRRKTSERDGRAVDDQAFRTLAANEAESMGLAGASGGKVKNGTKAQVFLNQMQEKYDAWTRDPKNAGQKHPPEDVVREMIGKALVEGEVTGNLAFGMVDEDKWAFEAEAKGELERFVPNDVQPRRKASAPAATPPPAAPPAAVPESDRALIVEAYQSKLGRDPTDAEVAQAYAKKAR